MLCVGALMVPLFILLVVLRFDPENEYSWAPAIAFFPLLVVIAFLLVSWTLVVFCACYDERMPCARPCMVDDSVPEREADRCIERTTMDSLRRNLCFGSFQRKNASEGWIRKELETCCLPPRRDCVERGDPVLCCHTSARFLLPFLSLCFWQMPYFRRSRRIHVRGSAARRK